MKRRKFIQDFSALTGGLMFGSSFLNASLLLSGQVKANPLSTIYISKNGTPAENIAKVIELRFGGIENFIDSNDIVVINPNGQNANQGATNTESCMSLIDLILNRPGGFNGEIIFTECTQSVLLGYWPATGTGLDRNGPYNFNDMISYFQNNGHTNVTGVRIWPHDVDADNWPFINGPEDGQGWVPIEWTSVSTGRLFGLPYPIIRSPFSNKLIDYKNGAYDNGYANQPAVKFIKMPTLNNHGYNANQDYAGITSATKSFLGLANLGSWGGHYDLHAYDDLGAYAVGEAIGAFINLTRMPDLFITTAEWVGWGSRTSPDATNAKTIGLAHDPVSLDYIMSKYVLWPTHTEQQYFNPDYDVSNNKTRQTLNGCNSQGFGTTVESEITTLYYDFTNPIATRQQIDLMIKKFREGEATEQDVLNLINSYNGIE